MKQFFVHVESFRGREGFSELVDWTDAVLTVRAIAGCGGQAQAVEATRDRRRQVAGVFAAAAPPDRGGIVLIRSDGSTTHRREIRMASIGPTCHDSATCTVTPIDEKVASAEQLAAALHLPPAAVFEMPSPAEPQPTLLARVLDAMAALALALLGVPQPRKE